MKSVPPNQFIKYYSRLAVLPLLLLALFITSCQKEPEPIVLSEAKASIATARTTEIQQDVVSHTQWVIDNMLPLALDADVRAAITSGDFNSTVVTAKLASLGFSSFEQFSAAYSANGSAVFSAVSSGDLTASGIKQFVNGFVFDLGPLDDDGGDGAALPCTQQLQTALALTPVVVTAASETGPGAVAAGLIHILVAYLNYQDCMRATYPNGY
jgi:hypothetical protein